MPTDTLAALVMFAFVMSITPGPNNVLLLTSGVNFGWARTVPLMLGVGVGFMLMIVLVGLGFGQVFVRFPWTHAAVQIVGIVYMLWLAWTFANAGAIREGEAKARPMTFLQGAAFQWVNPKGWAIAVTATAAYTMPDAFTLSVLIVALVFGLVTVPSVSCWALFGTWMRRFLSRPRTVRVFNVTMALLLVASLWPAVAELLQG
ncbi:MAG: LysE family translocator [Alphaproteobacteria bacterium]|nr:LysE family translocator [Alphaproteobacteria bacterium]